MAKDLDNFDDNALEHIAADSNEMDKIISSVWDMQQKLMGKMQAKKPGDMTDQELQDMAAEFQSDEFQSMCRKLMGMQQKYMGALTGSDMPEVGNSPVNDDVKHQLGSLKSKVREVVEQLNNVIDSIDQMDVRTSSMEEKIAKLESRIKSLEGK